MKDLALMIGAIMPENVLLDQLKEALENHMLHATEDTRDKLALHCILIMSKFSADKNPKGALGLMEDSARMEKMMALGDLKDRDL